MQVARVDDAAAAAAGVGAALDAACSGELTSAALSQHLIRWACTSGACVICI